jgi:hypothetical protein
MKRPTAPASCCFIPACAAAIPLKTPAQPLIISLMRRISQGAREERVLDGEGGIMTDRNNKAGSYRFG